MSLSEPIRPSVDKVQFETELKSKRDATEARKSFESRVTVLNERMNDIREERKALAKALRDIPDSASEVEADIFKQRLLDFEERWLAAEDKLDALQKKIKEEVVEMKREDDEEFVFGVGDVFDYKKDEKVHAYIVVSVSANGYFVRDVDSITDSSDFILKDDLTEDTVIVLDTFDVQARKLTNDRNVDNLKKQKEADALVRRREEGDAAMIETRVFGSSKDGVVIKEGEELEESEESEVGGRNIENIVSIIKAKAQEDKKRISLKRSVTTGEHLVILDRLEREMSEARKVIVDLYQEIDLLDEQIGEEFEESLPLEETVAELDSLELEVENKMQALDSGSDLALIASEIAQTHEEVESLSKKVKKFKLRKYDKVIKLTTKTSGRYKKASKSEAEPQLESEDKDGQEENLVDVRERIGELHDELNLLQTQNSEGELDIEIKDELEGLIEEAEALDVRLTEETQDVEKGLDVRAELEETVGEVESLSKKVKKFKLRKYDK